MKLNNNYSEINLTMGVTFCYTIVNGKTIEINRRQYEFSRNKRSNA
jgi:hypothetical protein